MRRKLALIAVLGGLATGLGCQHIGGKTDCGYNPADYQLPQISSPYPLFPVLPLPKKDKDPGDVKGKSDSTPKDKEKDKEKNEESEG